ncbi:hypothetical protein ACH0B6_20565 [Solibacillus silvestris]
MEIAITGIGNMKDLIFEELSTRRLPIKAREYQSLNEFDGLTLLVYDGLQINEALKYVQKNKLNVIPVFVELDRVLIAGKFNSEGDEGVICPQCGISRLKEYFAPAKMHQTVMEQSHCFERNYFLKEEMMALCDQIINYIENDSLNKNIGSFSLDYYTTIFKEISGYTNCDICDNRDSKIEELIFAVKGANKNVIITN